MSNYYQLTGLFRSVVLGVLYCLLYDIIRAARKVRRHGTWAVFAEDILFSAVMGVTAFTFMMSVTNGDPRSFVFTGLAIGFLLSRFTLSRIFVPFAVFVFSAVKWIFKLVSGLFYGIFDALERFSRKILKNSAKTLKKLLQKIKGMLY